MKLDSGIFEKLNCAIGEPAGQHLVTLRLDSDLAVPKQFEDRLGMVAVRQAGGASRAAECEVHA